MTTRNGVPLALDGAPKDEDSEDVANYDVTYSKCAHPAHADIRSVARRFLPKLFGR